MSELLPLDLTNLNTPAPKPLPGPVIASSPALPPSDPRQTRRNWLMIAMVALIVFLLVVLLGRGRLPIPTPTPDVNIDGQYVLLLVDESQPDEITANQAQVLSSAKVAAWCDSNDVQYRRLDPRDDLGPVEDVWKELKRVATDPPSMTTLSDGKVKTQPVPAGVELTLRELAKVFD